MKRSNAPIFWLLFGAGGMLSALLGAMLVFITGIAAPLGLLSAEAMGYERMLGFSRHWFGKGFLFVVISLFAWHAAHRLLCTVHDFGIHKDLRAKLIGYGSATLITVVTAFALLGLGF